jgi:hypothetical protein
MAKYAAHERNPMIRKELAEGNRYGKSFLLGAQSKGRKNYSLLKTKSPKRTDLKNKQSFNGKVKTMTGGTSQGQSRNALNIKPNASLSNFTQNKHEFMVSPKMQTTKAADCKNKADKFKNGHPEKVTTHRSTNSFKSVFLQNTKRLKGSSDFNSNLK